MHARSRAQRCRVGDHGFAARDVLDGSLVHVLPRPCVGLIAYRDTSCWVSVAPVHDSARCGHGTFFADRLANDWVGRVIGVLTLTPYDRWRRTHAIHHATTGNLDRRGIVMSIP